MTGPHPIRPAVPLWSDAVAELSAAQKDALSSLAACTDPDGRRNIEHWIRRWDEALGRGDTIAMQRRIAEARRVHGPYIYENGAGI